MTVEYKTLEKVAKGGSGVVYRAQLRDGLVVAVKRLKKKYATSRLISEAELLASFNHPNIVEFYAVHRRSNGKLDLVMEWVGPKLSRLTRSGKLPLGIVVYIGLELLSALDYLDGRGKVHRDLSPRNVLLGVNGQVKLADFGISKPANAVRTTTTLKGSQPYMSLEQANGGKVDGKSDLFTLGVLLYELVTGAPPFASAAELVRMPRVLPVSMVRPNVPAQLSAVIARLLEYNRKDRFASAQEATAALARVYDGALGPSDVETLMSERGLFRESSWTWRGVGTAAALAASMAIGAGSMYAYGAATSAAIVEAVAPSSSVVEPGHEPTATAELCVAESADDEIAQAEKPPAHKATAPPVTKKQRRFKPSPKQHRPPVAQTGQKAVSAQGPAANPVSDPKPERKAAGASYDFLEAHGASFDFEPLEPHNSGK